MSSALRLIDKKVKKFSILALYNIIFLLIIVPAAFNYMEI